MTTSSANGHSQAALAIYDDLMSDAPTYDYDFASVNGCRQPLSILANARKQGIEAAKGVVESIKARPKSELAVLLAERDREAQATSLGKETLRPPLPPHVQANEARADEASPTLDALINYFKRWATRSYEGYHEAVAVWVLTTIAARRVVLRWRNGVWPSLYIMIVSVSGRHAKTEAASYGRKVIEDCGLDFLLTPDEITPQQLLSRMSGTHMSRNYRILKPEDQEAYRLRLAFSGQKGWLYDEFGDFLQDIVNGKGQNTLFYRLIKQLYDNKTTLTYDTVTRGDEKIDMPSLSLIGTTAPESLVPVAGAKSSAWTDGAMARFAFIVPPADSVKLQSAPDGEAIVDPEILEKLIDWHVRLGEPSCEIIDTAEREEMLDEALGKENGKKKGRDLPEYIVERGELPQNEITWGGSGVREAHEQYYQALVMMSLEQGLDPRLNSNYIRFPDMALKIGMLLASLENNGKMDMRHWARGQAITERWRESLHTLMAQLGGGEITSTGALEDAVIDLITKTIPRGEKFTARKLIEKGNRALRSAGSATVRKILEELYGQGSVIGLVREGQAKKAQYWIQEGGK